MKILAHYQNGNYKVTLFEDGTKIRANDLDNLTPDNPESFDCKITNQCPMQCKFCHEQSTPDGLHGDIMNARFIDTLMPGSEMAIGGGAVTSHPDLIPFLKKLKEQHVFPSITIHQQEYINNYDLIENLINEKLIYGLGVSFSYKDDEFWDKVSQNPNMVIHLINGIHGEDVFNYLANKGIKILILGYKNWGRGNNFYEIDSNIEPKKQWLFDNIREYAHKFKIISFDNLGIEQLNPKRFLTQEQWETFYQGEDGNHTMYVDLVKREFAQTSTSADRYELKDSIKEMFDIVRVDM